MLHKKSAKKCSRKLKKVTVVEVESMNPEVALLIEFRYRKIGWWWDTETLQSNFFSTQLDRCPQKFLQRSWNLQIRNSGGKLDRHITHFFCQSPRSVGQSAWYLTPYWHAFTCQAKLVDVVFVDNISHLDNLPLIITTNQTISNLQHPLPFLPPPKKKKQKK